ncbi:uncharacterized protein LOC124643815 [Helicoverpa zea]|uniref:uncharacterized protein LOC124643815 n=1 Tax=Helicoverpa zea TaxID=7113 RepID=UPI001F58EC63|nr:uncharacterized protein LOC124643815 [Helicoverpa zea]
MVTVFWFTLFPLIFGGNCVKYQGAETGYVIHNIPFIFKYHNNDKLNIFLTLTNMNQNMSVGVYFSYHTSGGKLNERVIEGQETSTAVIFLIDLYLLHKPYVKVHLSLYTEIGYVNKTIANGTLAGDNGQDTSICVNPNMCKITVDAAEVAKEINAAKEYTTSTTIPRTTKRVTKSTIIRQSSTDFGNVVDTTTTEYSRDKIRDNTRDNGRDDGNHPRDTATDKRRDNANNPRDTARDNGRDNANNPSFTTRGNFRDQPSDPRDTVRDNRRDNANNPRDTARDNGRDNANNPSFTTRGNFGNHPRENARDNERDSDRYKARIIAIENATENVTNSLGVTVRDNESDNTADKANATVVPDNSRMPQSSETPVLIYIIPVVVACLLIPIIVISMKRYRLRNSRQQAVDIATYSTKNQVLYAELDLATANKEVERNNEDSPYVEIIGVLLPKNK